jgi:rhodanese-related sulfurtransferase
MAKRIVTTVKDAATSRECPITYPASPYYKPIFGEDKKFVFFCAGALRSALAAKTAQDMGLKPVAHILGGFKGWKEAGGPVEPGGKKPG